MVQGLLGLRFRLVCEAFYLKVIYRYHEPDIVKVTKNSKDLLLPFRNLLSLKISCTPLLFPLKSVWDLPCVGKTTLSYYCHQFTNFSGVADDRSGMFWEVSDFDQCGDNFTWQRHVTTFSLLSNKNLLHKTNLLDDFRGKKKATIFYN